MYALKFIYFLAKRVSIVISVTKCQCIIVLVVLSVLAGRVDLTIFLHLWVFSKAPLTRIAHRPFLGA